MSHRRLFNQAGEKSLIFCFLSCATVALHRKILLLHRLAGGLVASCLRRSDINTTRVCVCNGAGGVHLHPIITLNHSVGYRYNYCAFCPVWCERLLCKLLGSAVRYSLSYSGLEYVQRLVLHMYASYLQFEGRKVQNTDTKRAAAARHFGDK